ncbi:hypothetical protein ABRQ03_14920 [Pectobacterium jejuense]|uniref:hypothetical protein n=1 Tax=Pectobacterium jejuense TaxID=2974022 RepID=UPI0032EB0889
MSKEILDPIEQTIRLNTYLIESGDKLPSPVITVGGQAIVYWISTYLTRYPQGKEPDISRMRTIDVDYVARRESASVISDIFNVQLQMQDPFTPPSIAVLNMIDRDTGKIKEDAAGNLFADPLMNSPNLVDIIDRPAGFEAKDFSDAKLRLNTELFQVLPEQHGSRMTHEMVRILNPVACIRSRLGNITQKVKRDVPQEIERIKALLIPAYHFLMDKLEGLSFREARPYVDAFAQVIWDNRYRRTLVNYQLPLYKILAAIQTELATNKDNYDLPIAFIERELPAIIRRHEETYKRLCNQYQ